MFSEPTITVERTNNNIKNIKIKKISKEENMILTVIKLATNKKIEKGSSSNFKYI